MTTETYHKVGRGGAGNFYSDQDIEEATGKTREVCLPLFWRYIQDLYNWQDLEAHSADASSDITSSSRVLPDYAHSGRGGAGNWYSPPDLQKTGNFFSDTGRSMPRPDIGGAGYSGRGGAGNFSSKDQEMRRLEEERLAEKARSKREAEIVKDVELGLKPPEKAHLGVVSWNEETGTLA